MRQEKDGVCIQLATQLTDKSHSIHVNGPKYILEETQLYIFREKYSGKKTNRIVWKRHFVGGFRNVQLYSL